MKLLLTKVDALRITRADDFRNFIVSDAGWRGAYNSFALLAVRIKVFFYEWRAKKNVAV